MSSLVEPKLTWKEDILNHDDTRTNVETRSWKAVRGLVQDGRCRVCHERDLAAGCKVLAKSEYLLRHNSALMIMAVA